VIRALVTYRSCTPNPAVYFVGAGGGLVLVLILKLALGWPWWTVPIATAAGPGIVWLIFLSTAFGHRVRGAGPSGHSSIKGLILQEIAPRRAAARDDRLREEMWRHLPFEPFGLPPTWQGERWARGTSWSGSVVSSVELAFGREGDDNGPLLRVGTASNDRPARRSLRTAAEELWWSAREMPHGLSPEQMAGWHRRTERDLAARAEPRWSPLVLPVDGRPVRFDVLAEGRWWVARREADDRSITIWGRSWPIDELELVTVADIEPYVEGWRRLMERLRKEHRRRNVS
jgi:hypothetical protein